MSGSPSPRKVFTKTAMLAHETAASEMVSVVVSAVAVDMLLGKTVIGTAGHADEAASSAATVQAALR